MATSRKKTTTASIKVASKKPKKVINLDTVQVTNAALPAPASIYEILGRPSHKYGTITVAQYQESLEKMDLIGLQDEAYLRGTTASASREHNIRRLIEKFHAETNRFAGQSIQTPAAQLAAKTDEAKKIEKDALAFLARGR